MSNIDLKKLAEEAKQILRTSQQSRSEEYNKQPHLYTVNRQTIIQEALVQIGKTRDTITAVELEQLTDAATNYCKRLHDAFNMDSNPGVRVFAKSKINFYVIISANIDVYRKIYEVRVSEKGGLRKFTNELHKIFPESKKIHSVAFDVGHKAGSSIAELTIQRALAKFISVPKVSGQGARVINKVINIAVKSYEKVDLGKAFYIEVKDESAIENQRKGREEEKLWLKQTKDILEELIKVVDWPNQRGSRSAIEAITSNILSSGKKSGARIKGEIHKKSSPSKISTKLKTSQKTPAPKKIKAPFVDNLALGKVRKSANNNWLSLIDIINSKLPDRVSKNMGAPGLIYRTGRLANSAKIVNIETTKEGFPSLVFDYNRSPYDVFDRTKGVSPWNTPARDPRTLVDKSVREVVREMAIGRFYTRRA